MEPGLPGWTWVAFFSLLLTFFVGGIVQRSLRLSRAWRALAREHGLTCRPGRILLWPSMHGCIGTIEVRVRVVNEPRPGPLRRPFTEITVRRGGAQARRIEPVLITTQGVFQAALRRAMRSLDVPGESR